MQEETSTHKCTQFNSYSASHSNWCTATLWNRIMTVQCEGMGEVGSARYEPALLPPCPSIRALSYRNCQRDPPIPTYGLGSVSVNKKHTHHRKHAFNFVRSVKKRWKMWFQVMQNVIQIHWAHKDASQANIYACRICKECKEIAKQPQFIKSQDSILGPHKKMSV